MIEALIISLCLLAFAVVSDTAHQAAVPRRGASRLRMIVATLVVGALLAAMFVFAGCYRDAAAAVVPRIVHVHDSTPCAMPLPPPAPLEEWEADPNDGAAHDRVICGALEPWECDLVRSGVWATYGRIAAGYIETVRAECAKPDEVTP